MSALIVTAETLIGMAQQSAYLWMRSLEPVRLVVQASRSNGCSTCPGARASDSPRLNKRTYLSVVQSSQFQREVLTLKTVFGYSSIEILADKGQYIVL